MVHALLAEDREENNIDRADAAHKEVNKTINKGQRYELYGDVYRLLPDHIKPECLEKVVEIEPYEREEKRKRGSPKKNDSAPAKRKRNDEVARNIPDGANTGFVSVRDLLVKAPKKRKTAATMAKNFETCGEDDETDEDIASGRVFAPAQLMPASGDKPTSKAKPQKSAIVGKTKAIKPKRMKKVNEPTPSQFSKQGADDSDDMDIAQGAILPANITTPEPILQPSPQLSPTKQVDVSVLELSDSEHGHVSLAKRQVSPLLKDDDQDMGWIVNDDDDDDNTLNFEIVDSPPDSPLIPKHALPSLERMQVGNDSIEISMPQKRHPSSSSKTLVNDSMVENELVKKRTFSKRKFIVSSSPEILSPLRSPDANLVASGSTSFGRPITPSPASSPYKIGTCPAPDNKGKAKVSSMLPPALPRRFLASPAIPENDVPEPSFPIRPAGANITKKRRIISNNNEPSSPSFEMPAPSQRRRLHRLESTPPVRKTAESEIKGKSKQAKPSLLSRNPNTLFDGEAIHSGDEVSEGRSSTEDEESESDRLFLKDSPATQASQSYDQILAYQQSLLTQAPAKNVGILPMFANRATRHKPFGRINGARSRRYLPSSSPPPPDEDLDHYDIDSFVVGDDEIS
jgi:ATP-dependent DNA helicase MPH1